jgi:hypothetical protein
MTVPPQPTSVCTPNHQHSRARDRTAGGHMGCPQVGAFLLRQVRRGRWRAIDPAFSEMVG